MRLDGLRETTNIDDRRAGGGRRMVALGGFGTLVVVVISMLLGVDPRMILSEMGGAGGGAPSAAVRSEPRENEEKHFVAKILASTEDVWSEQFAKMGKQYEKPALVLFRDATESNCGYAAAAVGPFYCPADEKVYLDLEFFDELSQRFKAPGDFAQAYVIAHEVGHHVQKLLGTSDQYERQVRQARSKAERNALSVRLELQADFLAGVWAYHANRSKQILEPGDVEEGLRAAAAIGDDKLQRQSQGYVVPDAFTHGTSAQRLAWFKKGMETGDINQGDTFKGRP